MSDSTGNRGASEADVASESASAGWPSIGTVVGNASTDGYTFILRSMKAKLGDIVACRLSVPTGDRQGNAPVVVWGRITEISRFNPFFPAEAAQELANENIKFLETVLSNSRDHLEAQVLILGITAENKEADLALSPLTYPVQPSAEVLYPPPDAVIRLLTGGQQSQVRLPVGSLIGRPDVPVELSAREVVSRHLAILAMTGGGKTVAARRIIRELIRIGYPLVIFDPHGDYLGLYERRAELGEVDVKLFYPRIHVKRDNVDTISDLISKMGAKLTDPQLQFHQYLMGAELREGAIAAQYLQDLIDYALNIRQKKRQGKEHLPDELQDVRDATMNAVIRNLSFVKDALSQMERNNERLRGRLRDYEFTRMPDPRNDPEQIVQPKQVSIFYLAGYDHHTQSAIVSIVLENLFAHRAKLTGEIAPFQAVIEEAHNFIPSRTEGTSETPSLQTIRKVITEGRKFGTGLILISQRPSRLDETTLAQCNSFLVLRLVNPRDKSFVRSVMENLSEADANILQAFGRGQGLVSGQAVRFPLLVQIKFDEELISRVIGDEDFIAQVSAWTAPESQAAKSENNELLSAAPAPEKQSDQETRRAPTGRRLKRKPKSRGLRPSGY